MTTECPDCSYLREKVARLETQLSHERVQHDRVLLGYAEKHAELLAVIESLTPKPTRFGATDGE